MKQIKNRLFIILALIFFILTILGIILPLVPATPFGLLTAYFLSESSPTLHNKLLSLPVIGPAILDWNRNRRIKKSIKVLVFFIFISSAFIVWTNPKIPIYWAKIPVTLLFIGVFSFILSTKSH